MFPSLGTIELPVSDLPSKHKLIKYRKPRPTDVTFLDIHSPKTKARMTETQSLKQQSTPDFRTNPMGAAELMFQQMHRMSVRAEARVQHYRHTDVASVSEKNESPQSSQMTISNATDKMKPRAKAYMTFGVEEDMRVVPRHLMEADVTQEPSVRNVKEGTHTLFERFRDADNVSCITAVIKYKDKLIYIMKPLNSTATPASALKVQWRISRYLLTPSFFLVFSMLNRYGSVVALIKRTYNSALCVYETIDQATRALTMHSLHQSSKLLILSWWHPKYASLTNETTTSRHETARWLQTVCQGIFQNILQEPGTSDSFGPPSGQFGSKRFGMQSQRHVSMVKVEVKRALRRYTECMQAPDDLMTLAGTMPLMSSPSAVVDVTDTVEGCCKSKLDFTSKLFLGGSLSKANVKKDGGPRE